jgi:hypothetical protein
LPGRSREQATEIEQINVVVSENGQGGSVVSCECRGIGISIPMDKDNFI